MTGRIGEAPKLSLWKRLKRIALTDVGAMFGRDRTTVSYGCLKVEYRRDDPILGLKDSIDTGARKPGPDSRDGRALNRDIRNAIQPRSRIDNPSTGDKQSRHIAKDSERAGPLASPRPVHKVRTGPEPRPISGRTGLNSARAGFSIPRQLLLWVSTHFPLLCSGSSGRPESLPKG